MSEFGKPGELVVMQTGARPIAEPRLLIQSAFDADMERLGTVSESEEVRALHRQLVKGEISKDTFLEAVRVMLEAVK